jgi:hypothetical protein
VAVAGIGTPGATRLWNVVPPWTAPWSMRKAATSTSRALRGSRPVVSVSRVTASMAKSGVTRAGEGIGVQTVWPYVTPIPAFRPLGSVSGAARKAIRFKG